MWAEAGPDLYSVVSRVADEDVSLRVGGYTLRPAELALDLALRAVDLHVAPIPGRADSQTVVIKVPRNDYVKRREDGSRDEEMAVGKIAETAGRVQVLVEVGGVEAALADEHSLRVEDLHPVVAGVGDGDVV